MEIIANGYYIPFLYLLSLYIFRDIFHVTIIIMKLYSVNHFYWFGELYNYQNIPKQFNFIKQFVRMTDTGYFVYLLYIIDPSYLQLAHNVQFFITLGYWTGNYIGSNDEDNISFIHKNEYDNAVSNLSHIIPYLLFVRELIISKQCYSFDLHTLWISYGWNYIWLLFIYVPWRMYTGDVIYTIFHDGTEKIVKFFCFLHLLVFMANITGYTLTYIVCKRYLL
jgi:hypothetical protein